MHTTPRVHMMMECSPPSQGEQSLEQLSFCPSFFHMQNTMHTLRRQFLIPTLLLLHLAQNSFCTSPTHSAFVAHHGELSLSQTHTHFLSRALSLTFSRAHTLCQPLSHATVSVCACMCPCMCVYMQSCIDLHVHGIVILVMCVSLLFYVSFCPSMCHVRVCRQYNTQK